MSEAKRAARRRNRDRIREQNRLVTLRNPEAKREQRQRYNRENPERHAAYRAVEYALKTGVLVRPERCQRCGDEPERWLHGHHADYSKPLDVMWLCPQCHKDVHREEAEEAMQEEAA